MGWSCLYFQKIDLSTILWWLEGGPFKTSFLNPQTVPYYIRETLETDHWKKFAGVTIFLLRGEREVRWWLFINSKHDKIPLVLQRALIEGMIPCFPYFPTTFFSKYIHTSMYVPWNMLFLLELVIASVLGLNLYICTTSSSRKLKGATVLECCHCWGHPKGLEIVVTSCILPNISKPPSSCLAFTLSALALY